jgi:DNA-binding NtrC family response regulator
LPRILVIEDDANVRPIIEHVLLTAGHAVDTAATMRDGLDLLRQRGYDLVVADARLPDGNGLQIGDRAAEMGIRFILITGYAFSFAPEELQRFEVLLKPLRPREITMAVDQALA